MTKEQQAILKAVEILIAQRLSSIGCIFYIDGVVTAASNGLYTVKNGDNLYEGLKARSGLSLKVGSVVQVLVKNGDPSRKFIDDVKLI